MYKRQPDTARQRVRVVLDFPKEDEPLMVRVDSDLMRQAILNLVLNGLQSMTGEGMLTLKARRDDEMILAEVLDQGCGIPSAAQEKIFELYFTTKGDKGGSGIGPVSYTHLDVYKRQICSRLTPGRGMCASCATLWNAP